MYMFSNFAFAQIKDISNVDNWDLKGASGWVKMITH